MSVIRLRTAWSHEGDTVGCGLHPIHRGHGTVRKHPASLARLSWLPGWPVLVATWGLKKETHLKKESVYERSRKEKQLIFVCLFYLRRIPLVRFKSIKKQLKEKGELEEFWRNHHPDVFARRYLHCFPADIALSAGTTSERLYDYMNVSTVLVMQS